MKDGDPTGPIAVVGPGRRGGRPAAPEPRGTVSTWIGAAEHDALIRLAASRGESVSAVVRALIRRGIPTRKLG